MSATSAHAFDCRLSACALARSLDGCPFVPPPLSALDVCLQVQAAPPKPSDETVFIEERAPLDVYVKAFGGWAVGQTYLQVCVYEGGGRGCRWRGGGKETYMVTYLQVCWSFWANRSARVWGVFGQTFWQVC